jgi:hypothetical protein
MGWLDRIRTRSEQALDPDEPEGDAPASVERTSPGLAALFAGMKADGRHSILDLGDANNQQLRILGPYARQIRFVGLVPLPPSGEALAAALAGLLRNVETPFDVVVAWDVLDRLAPADREALLGRIVEATAPGARLYASVDVSGAEVAQPVRSTLVSVDRVRQVTVGPPGSAKPQLLPAQAERLLSPFEVDQAFSLRVGVREYVATKR